MTVHMADCQKNLKLGKKNNNISVKILKERNGNAIRNKIEKIVDKHSNIGRSYLFYMRLYTLMFYCTNLFNN